METITQECPRSITMILQSLAKNYDDFIEEKDPNTTNSLVVAINLSKEEIENLLEDKHLNGEIERSGMKFKFYVRQVLRNSIKILLGSPRVKFNIPDFLKKINGWVNQDLVHSKNLIDGLCLEFASETFSDSKLKTISNLYDTDEYVAQLAYNELERRERVKRLASN